MIEKIASITGSENKRCSRFIGNPTLINFNWQRNWKGSIWQVHVTFTFFSKEQRLILDNCSIRVFIARVDGLGSRPGGQIVAIKQLKS